jgi:hypothetical protein
LKVNFVINIIMVVHSIIISESDVRMEMNRTLMEWGVRRGYSRQHDDFFRMALLKALEYASGASSRAKLTRDSGVDDDSDNGSWKTSFFSSLEINAMPTDQKEAIRYVLFSYLDEGQSSFFDAEDRLHLDYAPFYESKSRSQNAATQYRRRREFERFSLKDIDPLERFVRQTYSLKEWYRKLWHDVNSLKGHVFEALVAHHMVFSMPCESCKFRRLRWNGGLDSMSSWMDVVCMCCRAAYEIKSKASDDKLEKCHQYNSCRGGSFRTFYGRFRAADSKKYLIVVSRGATYNAKTSSFMHRVDLGEIAKVVPRLCSKSFINTGSQDKDDIRIVSDVSIRRGTLKRSWCRVPALLDGTDEDLHNTARDVFNSRFGRGAWQRTSADKVTTPPNSEPRREDQTGLNAKPRRKGKKGWNANVCVDELRKSLDAMKVATIASQSKKAPSINENGCVANDDEDGGDWEDLYHNN